MLLNQLKIILRGIRRSPIFSFINIFGLAGGLACSILILLWVADELSWDHFNKNASRLYRVYINRPGDGGTFTQTVVPLALWDELKKNPAVENISPTNTGANVTLAYKEQKLEKTFLYTGEDFLKMFSFPLIEGDLSNQLNSPSSIVLTQSTAKALFGGQDALGKTIRMDNQKDLTVSGIVADPPAESTLQFQCLIPFQVAVSLDPSYKEIRASWDHASFNLFVELTNGADASKVEAEIRDILKPHGQPDFPQQLMLFPYAKTHLYSKFENGKSIGGAITYVQIFSVIAIAILALACINFMNLATARSEKRSKEVGIRKSVGSRSGQLIRQFLAETMVIATVAFGVALLIVMVALPAYNSLVGKRLFIDYATPVLWGIAILFIIITGFAAGMYPAFILSSFQPARVLKGRSVAGNKGNLPRKIMVTLQFFFSIGLILATVIIYRQVTYLKDRDAGYNKDNLLMIPTTGTIPKLYPSIKNDLLNKALASNVTIASAPVTDLTSWTKIQWEGQRDDQKDYMALISAGNDYAKTLGIKILQGREFEESHNDTLSMMLNQAAVDYMGLKEPLGLVVTMGDRQYTVTGVLDNAIMTSPDSPAQPTLFVDIPQWTSDIMIRMPKGNPHGTLAKIQALFQTYNPEFPFSYSFADQEYNRKFANEELIQKLADIFSALAILISCFGLFGLAAFAAEQRTKEIGIRKVLGASISGILLLFSKEFSRLIFIAFMISTPVTWWVMSRWLSHYPYHIQPRWWMFAGTGIFVLVLTWLIVGITGAKAALTNPVKTLRSE